MGRRPEQTFFQIIHSDDQQGHEKILNIVNHQRNVNQNCNQLSPHTYPNGYHQKDQVSNVARIRWRLVGISGDQGDLVVAQIGKASACNAEDLGLIPELGRFPGEGNGNPLQYSCLENSMDGGAWQVRVHGISKSQT